MEELPTVDAQYAEALAAYSQGDVLRDITSIPVGLRDEIVFYSCPYGAVVISQTCDVVQSNRATVQIAAIARLTGSTASEALDRKRPRYVPLPALVVQNPETGGKEAYFADLEVVGTITKNQLANCEREGGLSADDDVRKFGRDVARRYGRFAFPDEVTPWLKPLEDIIRSKHEKPDSPEGYALQMVDSFRITSANGWEAAPYALELEVILNSGILPHPGDEEPPIPDDIMEWFTDAAILPKSAKIASALKAAYSANPGSCDANRIYWLWEALARAWAAQCQLKKPEDAGPQVENALKGGRLEGSVESLDTYSVARLNRSVALDLDYLSPPLPRLID